MIAVTFDAGPVADRLAALGPMAADALRDVTADLANRLRDRAAANLSGEVLNARSGKLRDSLAATVDPSSRITATVSANTPYAAFQEYGFTGSEDIRAHLRLQTQAFGRPISPVAVPVRSYSRQVDYPAHSYLRTALAELAPDIRGTLAVAVAGAIEP